VYRFRKQQEFTSSPLKALVLQGKGKYAQQKHFGGCMHKEGVFCYLSLEAILLSKGKKKQMHNKSTLEDVCIRGVFLFVS
jgi:hypothetical protein